jgi:hypothetical protein
MTPHRVFLAHCRDCDDTFESLRRKDRNEWGYRHLQDEYSSCHDVEFKDGVTR